MLELPKAWFILGRSQASILYRANVEAQAPPVLAQQRANMPPQLVFLIAVDDSCLVLLLKRCFFIVNNYFANQLVVIGIAPIRTNCPYNWPQVCEVPEGYICTESSIAVPFPMCTDSFRPLFRPYRVWLVKPNKGLSTPVVFRHLDHDQLSRVEPTRLLKQFVEEGVAEAEYVNDLELPAFKAMPSLQKMKTELEVGTALLCRDLS